jgi:hypothetical protein
MPEGSYYLELVSAMSKESFKHEIWTKSTVLGISSG